MFLNSGPMFHIGNFQFYGIPVLIQGGTNVVTRRVIASEVLDILAAEKCTRAYLMPATVTQLVELMRERGAELPHLKATIAAPLWQGLVAADDSRHGREGGGMGYGYGQTEVTGFCLFGGYGGRGAGNAGRPAPVTSVRILDADGRECGIGEAGEICVRGDTVHLGYWNRPEINSQRFRGGWWHTTDLGRREPDGTITFLGTMTRMIKSGAENIFPAEVENCLEAHPAVKEAAIIGVPDERFAAGRQGGRGAERGRHRVGRGPHRALPAPHRLVQEAEDGGVPRRAAAHRRHGPRTTRRWTRSSAAGAIRVATTSAAGIEGRRQVRRGDRGRQRDRAGARRAVRGRRRPRGDRRGHRYRMGP